ncbi:MAG: hypothetical protein APF77_10435 [Clostridia bacterium BRH_c25]|nr:MAG: hypothetical protein APF77_10435 [Clostridia bacterium BRH_c25]
MVGLIITGHNCFAGGILGAAEMIMGRQENVAAVDFEEQDDIEILDAKLKEQMGRLDTSEGVILFADMAGGSPFNRSMIMMAENPEADIHVISGVNLPLLIEALNMRQYVEEIKQLVDDLMNISASAIIYGNKMLEDEMKK